MEYIYDLSDSIKSVILGAYGNDPKFQAAVRALQQQILAYTVNRDKVYREINIPKMLEEFFKEGKVGGDKLLDEGTIRKYAAAVAMANAKAEMAKANHTREDISYADFLRLPLLRLPGGAKRRRRSTTRRSRSKSKSARRRR